MKTKEIIEVLNAFEEGKKLEVHSNGQEWFDFECNEVESIIKAITLGFKIRFKPNQPKIEEVVLLGNLANGFYNFAADFDTHRITFNLVDGEIDCSSVKMEKI